MIRTGIYLFVAAVVAGIVFTTKAVKVEKARATIEANEAAEAAAVAELLNVVNSDTNAPSSCASGCKH